MSKHTAVPYRIGKNGAIVSDDPVVGMSGSDDIGYYGGHMVAESVTRTNAVFIVKACNCFYDMLEALKNIENDDGHIPATIWNLRNDAIAKAEAV